MSLKYVPYEFESKWVDYWEKNKTYQTPQLTDPKKKKYILSMFPYPSGDGLHVGHVRIYTGTDVIARFLRHKGYSVLHPMGFDAFGLPAENAAIKNHKNPMDMVKQNIINFKQQMQTLGLSYDWEKELATCDPSYYQITQWLFIQFYKAGLLEKRNTLVYFCDFCKTGLAEEEVLADGTHERCGKPITKKQLPQWVFKITKYADSLLNGLKDLNWPRGILEMQKNWIGKKEGAEIKFKMQSAKIKDSAKGSITVFTTRPDTVYGVTALIIAPEHELAVTIAKQNKEVQKYIKAAHQKSDLQRAEIMKDKTGVFTGLYAKHPLTDEDIPIWVADYILGNFGTGAVMLVPAHDQRDFEFAKKYNLPIKTVVKTDNSVTIQNESSIISEAYEGEGILINSDKFNGLVSEEARFKIVEYLQSQNSGKKQISYHLRDWIFSRQRYWGEPIPMVYCEKCGWQPLNEKDLPLELPYLKEYEPTKTGESPLAKVSSWVNTTCPKCKSKAKRETDTMPNWAGSCWYFLHFAKQADFKNKNLFKTLNFKLKTFDSSWLPVDFYLGGAEHAVLHLLYARFWVQILNDLKLLSFREPFLRLQNVGMVLSTDHRKMSKSLGNVINPNEMVKKYGADALRIYEMFMAPFDQEIAWNESSLKGSARFLARIYQIVTPYANIANNKIKEDKQLVSELQRLIQKVERDITDVKFNTAIASIMKFINNWERRASSKKFVLSIKNIEKFLVILAPFSPFIAEELWQNYLHKNTSIHLATWPEVDGNTLLLEKIVIPIQINGKIRAQIELSSDSISKEDVLSRALKLKNVQKYLNGNQYQVIYVPRKILSLVIS